MPDTWAYSFSTRIYGMHSFFWSTQNYINHAFSPRDIMKGAHNLKMNPLLKPFYLNWNYHLAHHQFPGVPWVHLSKFLESKKLKDYGTAYLKMWQGPKLTKEPPPKSLDPEFEKYLNTIHNH